MLTCHFYLLSNPVWPEMFGSQIYGFIFYGQNFTPNFFYGVYDKWGGPWADRTWGFNPPFGFLLLGFRRRSQVFFSGIDAFSWMAFASFVYLTDEHGHYFFEMDLVCLVKGVQFATIDV